MDWKLIAGILGGLSLAMAGVIYGILERNISEIKEILKERAKEGYAWRHDEYAPTIAEINSKLLPLVKQVEIIEKRMGLPWSSNR